MRILIIGSGGREHALAWKLHHSASVTALFCAPGNGGISEIAETVGVKTSDSPALIRFARENKIDLVVIGPEQPLVDGLSDLLRQEGILVFGPSKKAAQLEGSKVFAKEFMARHGIPTARFGRFSIQNVHEGERFIAELSPPIVVKADGLAAGKGVIIAETKDDAVEALHDMVGRRSFGKAGERVIIEEWLEGEEASILVISDGENFVTLPAAQDHKRIFDGDKGKNTGGMGAYAPAPLVTPDLMSQIEREIVIPTLRGMALEGNPYQGCLYVGLMITQTGPKVLEYNCRFGDPETQVVIPLIDGDFAELLRSAAAGPIAREHAKAHGASAVCVVMASGGYPGDYDTGKEIRGLDSVRSSDGVVVFHAGTRRDGAKVLTSGGRVLGVTALGFEHDLAGTIDQAYRAVHRIAFDGAYYRSDIGQKGIRRTSETQRTHLNKSKRPEGSGS